MPVQKGQASGFLSKLGSRVQQAHNKAKDKETDYGNLGDLPEDINGGVAQVVDAKVDLVKEGKKHAGEYYFYIGAVVLSPKTFNGVQVAGMRTMITGPLHDTPERTGEKKTFEHHWDWMLNELRKLGINTSTMQAADLEGVLQALREAKPFIRFRTWKGKATKEYPNPRVNHEWNGLATDFTPDIDQIGAVNDNSGDAGDQGGEATEPSNDDQQGEATAAGEQEDYEALGASADAENGEESDAAQTRLTELAKEVELTEAQIKKAPDWAALAALIAEKKAGGDGDQGGWKVGDNCKYAPKDPKDKSGKKRLKKTECSVIEINAEGDTVTLKDLDDTKKKYKGVSVNEIEPT